MAAYPGERPGAPCRRDLGRDVPIRQQLGRGAGRLLGLNTSGGNRTTDPFFVNRGAGDLHLQAGS